MDSTEQPHNPTSSEQKSAPNQPTPVFEDPLNASLSSEMTAASTDSMLRYNNNNVFSAYKQVGSELKHSLKAFETDNLLLSNKLYRLEQEIEVLRRRRNLQKNSLIGLQIKAEKLDQMKQLSLQECAADKRSNLDYLNKEFGAICDNDRFIRETRSKLEQLLQSDRGEVEQLMTELRREHVEQVQFLRKFQQTTESSFLNYSKRIKTASRDEKNVEAEMEAVLEICKSKAGVKEKHEFELQEKQANLKFIEGEVDTLKIKISELKDQLNEVIENNRQMNEKLGTDSTFYLEECEKREKDIENLLREAEVIQEEVADREAKLNNYVEERHYLLEQIHSAEGQIEAILNEIRSLTNQTEAMAEIVSEGTRKLKQLQDSISELRDVNQIEKNVADTKRANLEEVTSKNLIVNELAMKLDVLKIKWEASNRERNHLTSTEEEASRNAEAAKTTLMESNRDASDENLNKLEQNLSELKSVRNQLKEQLSDAREKLESAKNEIGELENENSALDRELEDVAEMEEETNRKLSIFEEERLRLEELKSKISSIRDEIGGITSSREFRVNVDELAGEVSKIRKEVEEKKAAHDDQTATIQTTFQKTVQNLQEQMSKLVQASTEEMNRRQSKINSLQCEMPNLQRGIDKVKCDLVRATEKNIAMMKDRLGTTDKLVEGYRTLQNRAKTTNNRNYNMVRLMGTIESHLEASFRGMADYLQMSPINDPNPSYFVYRFTLDSFASRFHLMTSQENRRLTDPSYLTELKTAAYCLFGMNASDETNESDSTLFSPSSSSIRD